MDPNVVFEDVENSLRYPSTKNIPRNTGSCESVLLDCSNVNANSANTVELIRTALNPRF